jgi:hypothetical protein
VTSPHPPVVRVVPIITLKGRAQAARCRHGQHPYKRPTGCHTGIPASRNDHLRAGHAREAAVTLKTKQGARGPSPGRPDDRPDGSTGTLDDRDFSHAGKEPSTSARRAGGIIIAATREATGRIRPAIRPGTPYPPAPGAPDAVSLSEITYRQLANMTPGFSPGEQLSTPKSARP